MLFQFFLFKKVKVKEKTDTKKIKKNWIDSENIKEKKSFGYIWIETLILINQVEVYYILFLKILFKSII